MLRWACLRPDREGRASDWVVVEKDRNRGWLMGRKLARHGACMVMVEESSLGTGAIRCRDCFDHSTVEIYVQFDVNRFLTRRFRLFTEPSED